MVQASLIPRPYASPPGAPWAVKQLPISDGVIIRTPAPGSGPGRPYKSCQTRLLVVLRPAHTLSPSRTHSRSHLAVIPIILVQIPAYPAPFPSAPFARHILLPPIDISLLFMLPCPLVAHSIFGPCRMVPVSRSGELRNPDERVETADLVSVLSTYFDAPGSLSGIASPSSPSSLGARSNFRLLLLSCCSMQERGQGQLGSPPCYIKHAPSPPPEPITPHPSNPRRHQGVNTGLAYLDLDSVRERK